jgi:recombination protein RecA
MLESKLFSLVILDSVGGMLTKEEMRKDAEDVVVGTSAKVITRMVKMAAIYARQSDAVVLLLNQVRAQIGGYGPDEVTSGGWALKHGTSMRFKFRRTQSGNTDIFKVGSGDEQTSVGFETAVVIEKNKCAPPKRRATLAIFNQPSAKFGPLVGIDVVRETANLTNRLNLLPKKGSWFIFAPNDDPKLEDKVNGVDGLVERLRVDPDWMTVLRQRALDSVAEFVTDDNSIQGDAVDLDEQPAGIRRGAGIHEDDGTDVLAGAEA